MKEELLKEIKILRKAVEMENELVNIYLSQNDYEVGYPKMIMCYERINEYVKMIGDNRVKLLKLGLKKYNI